MHLNWTVQNASAGDVVGFVVIEYQNGVPQAPIEVSDPGVRDLVLEGLDPDGLYVYIVEAILPDDSRVPSNPVETGPFGDCPAFTYTVDPPDAELHPECLPPE